MSEQRVPKYLSAEEYSKQSGMGVEEVKRQCRIGKINCLMTDGGYYKIPVYDGAVSIEQYEKVLQEKEKYKTIVNTLFATLKTVASER